MKTMQQPVRYALTTTHFFDGIEAIKSASIIMADVFNDVVDQDDTTCEVDAMWALLETITVHKAPKGKVPWKQRVLHVGKTEMEYQNSDGVIFCWQQQKRKEDTVWVFWVILPDEWYQEPTAGGLMAPRLERVGFSYEPLAS